MKHYRLYLDTSAAASALPSKAPGTVKAVLSLFHWTPCLWAFNADEGDERTRIAQGLASYLPFFSVQVTV